MSADLYDQDFYLWTQEQGAALRARRFGDNVLEIDRIAEEIEELGSAQRNKAESFVQRIIEHFYKLSCSQNPDPVRHWLVGIVNFRAALERALTPAIENAIRDDLEALHRRAFKATSQTMKLFEPDIRLDGALRWRLEEIAGSALDDPFDRFAAELEDENRPKPRPQ